LNDVVVIQMPDIRTRIAPLTIALVAANVPAYLAPHQITAYFDVNHLTPGAAGWLSTAEIGALAFSNIFAPLLPRPWVMPIAIGAAIIAAASELATTMFGSMGLLILLRAMVGVGCGLGTFASAQAIATSTKAARAFGIVNAGLAGVSAAALAIVPRLPGNASVRVFVPLSLICVLLGINLWLGRPATNEPVPPEQAQASPWLTVPVLALFLATALIFIALGGLWTFSSDEGSHLGLSDTAIGTILGWTTLLGLVGGGLAAWAPWGPGLKGPVSTACLLASLTCVAVGTARTPLMFAAAFALYSLTYQFAMSYLLTLGAVVDVSGRASAILVGIMLLAVAAGNVLVGTLLDVRMPNVAWSVGAAACVAAILPALHSASFHVISRPAVT
jgi:hypothetical protein